jgi:hypothetical protein
LKNELIIARYVGESGKSRAAKERLSALLAEFGLETMLDTRFSLV